EARHPIVEIGQTIDPRIHIAAVELGKSQRRLEYQMKALPIGDLARWDSDNRCLDSLSFAHLGTMHARLANLPSLRHCACKIPVRPPATPCGWRRWRRV